MYLRLFNRFILCGFLFCISFSFVAPASSSSFPAPFNGIDEGREVTSINKVNTLIWQGTEYDILHDINLHRDSMGLKPLQMNAIESAIALKHSKDMASGRTPFGHQGMDQRINAIQKQLGAVMAAAENVAYGQTTARDVVNDWLSSPGHRKNIEGDYTLCGIGLARDAQGIAYYTQIFTK